MMKFNAVKIITVMVTVQHGNMYMIMSSLPEAKSRMKNNYVHVFITTMKKYSYQSRPEKYTKS